jgi:hypothetical protein
MSTLQTTPHVKPSLRNALGAALATLAVLIAVAVAAIVIAPGGTTTERHVLSVATNSDTSAAYAPPHDDGVLRPTSTQDAGGIATNDQGSSAYTKAQLYKAGR